MIQDLSLQFQSLTISHDLEALVKKTQAKIEPANLPTYIQLLQQAKIDLNSLDHAPRTHQAAILNRPKLIPWDVGTSLDHCKRHEIDRLDSCGRSALHLAVYFNHVDVAKTLFDFGANPYIGTPLFGSALDVAIRLQRSALVELFSEHPHATVDMSPVAATATKVHSLLWEHIPRDSKQLDLALLDPALTDADRLLIARYCRHEKRQLRLYHTWEVMAPEIKTKNGDEVRPEYFYCLPKDSQGIFDSSSESYLSFSPPRGGFQPFFLDLTLKKTFECMTQNDLTTTEKEYFNTLIKSLHISCNPQEYSSAELISMWKEGTPLIFGITIEEVNHTVTFMVINDRTFLCNRGSQSRMSVEIHQFTSMLTQDIIDELRKKFATAQEYSTYFFKTLPTKLHYGQTNRELNLQSLLVRPGQMVDNCSWASLEMCVLTYFAHTYTSCSDETQSAMIKTKNLFFNWRLYIQLCCLDDYLRALYDPKSPFVSSYVPIQELQETYLAIKDQQWIWPKLRSTMEQIERKYPQFLQQMPF